MSMITYNIRYRGAFEYDKFILNIYQLYNEIKRINKNFNDNTIIKIQDKAKELNTIFNELTKENNSLEELLVIKERLIS